MSAEIFEKVAMFFFEDDEFADSFEKWANENCDNFTEDEEQKLEYTELFQTFSKMFEEKIQAFLEAQGMTMEVFQDECKKAAEEKNENWHFLEMLLAVTDYDMFVGMMREQNAKKKMGHDLP